MNLRKWGIKPWGSGAGEGFLSLFPWQLTCINMCRGGWSSVATIMEWKHSKQVLCSISYWEPAWEAPNCVFQTDNILVLSRVRRAAWIDLLFVSDVLETCKKVTGISPYQYQHVRANHPKMTAHLFNCCASWHKMVKAIILNVRMLPVILVLIEKSTFSKVTFKLRPLALYVFFVYTQCFAKHWCLLSRY